MKQINTKFGPIFMEDFSCREDETKIKIFDSEKRYLNYYEAESFDNEDELNDLVKEIEKYDDIEKLANLLFDGYEFLTACWKEMIDHLELEDCYTPADLLENEFINKIGNYYIAVTE